MVRQLTQLIRAATAGDHGAASDLLPMLYEELRRLARSRMAGLPPGQTLQPTALVHEAYLRLIGSDEVTWEDRGHFFFAAARAMHHILVEDARRKASLKNGGGRRRLDVDGLEIELPIPGDDMLALHEAMEDLGREDPRGYQVLMLRFFAGLTEEETAAILGVTERTVRRDWRFVRVALHKRLAEPSGTI